MKRIKIIIQFLGTNYSGWQFQPGLKTVQGEIQNAIFSALGEKVEVFSSGRTDAGVHAYAMPAYFDTNTKIQPNNIFKALNSYLPDDIRVLSSEEVNEHFHARFDVKEKTYEYHFYANIMRLPLIDATKARIPTPFDFDLAKSVCPYFVGTHDWKGFCSSGNSTATTVRTIKKMTLSKEKDGFVLSVTGDGFLYNMVRIIAGTIIEVGQGKIAPEKIPEIIKSCDRSLAGKTAEPRGLVLKSVKY